MELDKQMSLEYLKNNIYFFSLIDMLKTQHLTYEFVCYYILNSDYKLLPEEKKISIEDVCNYQPHLADEFSNKDLHLQKHTIVWPNFEEISNS